MGNGTEIEKIEMKVYKIQFSLLKLKKDKIRIVVKR